MVLAVSVRVGTASRSVDEQWAHTGLQACRSLNAASGGCAKLKDGTMRPVIALLFRITLLACIWCVWWWAVSAPLSSVINLFIIVGGVLLTFPLVWFGRKILDRYQTASSVAWITTSVHYALGLTFGVPIVRALSTHQDWSGWVLPVPTEIGLVLVVITGAACLLTDSSDLGWSQLLAPVEPYRPSSLETIESPQNRIPADGANNEICPGV